MTQTRISTDALFPRPALLASMSAVIAEPCEALLAGAARTPALEAAIRDEAQASLRSVRHARHRASIEFASTPPPQWRQPQVASAVRDGEDVAGPAPPRRRARDPLRDLERLERYERQAIARRKSVTRAFGDLVAASATPSSACRR